MRGLLLFLVLVLMSGCGQGPQLSPNLATGASSYEVIPTANASGSRADYRISPLDAVDVTVFGEPDLSVKAVQVDAAGMLSLPLVGSVPAAGKTPAELSQNLRQLLAQKYLKDPQVTATVATSASQKVAVQGEVNEPGVFDLKGPTTLLEALAMAKGEQRTAALDQVVVFRTVSSRRMGAVFDVQAIRDGRAEDPQILGSDMVVVGFSSAKRFWRDIITSSPLLNVFRPLAL